MHDWVDAALLTGLKAAEEAYFGEAFDKLDPLGKTAVRERYDAALKAVEGTATNGEAAE